MSERPAHGDELILLIDFQHFTRSSHEQTSAQSQPWCCRRTRLCPRELFGKGRVWCVPRWDVFCFYAADSSKGNNGVRIQSSKPRAAYTVAVLVAKSGDAWWPQTAFSLVSANWGLVLYLVPLKLLGKCFKYLLWLDPRKTNKMFVTRANRSGNCCLGLDSLESQQVPSERERGNKSSD